MIIDNSKFLNKKEDTANMDKSTMINQTIMNEEGKPIIVKENLEDTFVLSGKLNNKLEGKKNLYSRSCSGIVVHKVSFSEIEISGYLSTGKVISCKVNGRDVPLTLIENANVLENLISHLYLIAYIGRSCINE